jgi:hypothetical protein
MPNWQANGWTGENHGDGTMARMRLLAGGAPGACTAVCPYCGAEKEIKPPYEVAYCTCRDTAPPARLAPRR